MLFVVFFFFFFFFLYFFILFISTTTTKNKKPLKIFSNQLILKNIDFSYNYEADTSTIAGVNFDHIHLKKVNGTFEAIKIINDTIYTNIKSLSFRDRSGFQVFEMATYFKISPKEMSCEQLHLVTNKSKIKRTHSPFYY